MAKKKMKLFEEIVFDDVQYAVDVVNAYKRKRDKSQRALVVAAIATVCNLIALPEMIGGGESALHGMLGVIGICGAIVAYIMGGGVFTALRWAGRIAHVVWIVCFFPFDLLFGLLALMYGFAGFFCVPIIFVFMNYRQINLDYKAAKKYISYYKVRVQNSQPKATVSQTRSQLSSNRSYSGQTRTQASGNRNIFNQTQERQVRIQTLADGSKIYR